MSEPEHVLDRRTLLRTSVAAAAAAGAAVVWPRTGRTVEPAPAAPARARTRPPHNTLIGVV